MFRIYYMVWSLYIYIEKVCEYFKYYELLTFILSKT